MNKKQYFTMVELLAVIVIIMILAGILIGGIGYATKKADLAKTQSKMTQLEVALDLFKTEYGYYPPADAISDVQFLYDSSKKCLAIKLCGKTYSFVKRGTTRPLMEIGTEGEWQDSWEHAFKYQCPGAENIGSYDLWSYGPDGKSGNSVEKIDDICNWKRN